jgi:cyclin B
MSPIVETPPPDIDFQDRENSLCVTQYVCEIYSYYKAVENLFCTQTYMDWQPAINEKMRAILIDWLVEVHLKFDLMPETLFLTVQVIDRYLAIDRVTRKNLQLVGVTAMLIASKYEDIWAPEVRDFVTICDSAYTRSEILAMEKTILKKLEFKLTSPTSYHFLSRFFKACAVVDERPTEKRFEMLCMYGVEISFTEYDMMGYAFSKISAASVLLARQILRTGPWALTLEKHTGYNETDLQELANKILSLMKKAASANTTLKAVHKKYSTVRFHSVTELIHS